MYMLLRVYNGWEENNLHPKRTCNNCLKGTAITINNDILCIEKGVVSGDFVCSKHRYMPAFRAVKRKIYSCVDCENFIIFNTSDVDGRATGVCNLFTVRKYDGRQKKPCSKFVLRSKKEIS